MDIVVNQNKPLVLLVFEDRVDVQQFRKKFETAEVKDLIAASSNDPSDVRGKLNEAINSANSYDANLVISHFRPFEIDSSLPVIKLLNNRREQFYFDDFPGFEKNDLVSIIKFLEKRKLSKKESPVNKNKIRPVRGTKHHLQDDENRINSAKKRMQKAFMDVNNLKAMHLLMQLKDEKLTLEQKANKLNHANIPTSNGKSHTPKSVSRIEERITLFRENPIWEFSRGARVAMNVDSNSMPIYDLKETAEEMWEKVAMNVNSYSRPISEHAQMNFYNIAIKLKTLPLLNPSPISPENDFQDKIELLLEHSVNSDISIEFYNNSGESEYQTILQKGEKRKVIHVLKETFLLPGQYYAKFIAQGYAPSISPFTLYKKFIL
jgi:hypothetical protein